MFFCLPSLAKNGLWDPYELNVADLSRRIALNLYQATHLALDNADNSLPHLNDLGRPQLPFSSIAPRLPIREPAAIGCPGTNPRSDSRLR